MILALKVVCALNTCSVRSAAYSRIATIEDPPAWPFSGPHFWYGPGADGNPIFEHTMINVKIFISSKSVQRQTPLDAATVETMRWGATSSPNDGLRGLHSGRTVWCLNCTSTLEVQSLWSRLFSAHRSGLLRYQNATPKTPWLPSGFHRQPISTRSRTSSVFERSWQLCTVQCVNNS